jgi:alkylation response protein AidB-like acyl-CoA dehydrogenase
MGTSEVSFREELQAWLEANAPAGLRDTVSTPFQGFWGGTRAGFRTEDERVWFERCLARGWTAPAWPKAYGGGGMSPDEHRVWQEELSRMGMPLPLVGVGLTMLGPILLSYGTDAQRARWLPPIVRGEVRWCQGYSEPGAGSDLASLRTRAVRVGDDYVVDGQKIWTSHADLSDWIFCLVRTSDVGARQAGISFLLIRMDSPGITVRPISLISGASPFCEVFFEGVTVPVEQRIGPENEGWKVAKALLGHERGMVGESIAAGGARPPELKRYNVREHAEQVCGRTADGAVDEPLVERELLEIEDAEAALRLLIRRGNERSGAPGAESSVAKLVGSELNQQRWDLALRLLAMDGVGWDDAEIVPDETSLAITRHWLRSRANTIEGGSSEIQRDIVARHVLGLPKGGTP